jgi:non-heme chloroperoxidase
MPDLQLKDFKVHFEEKGNGPETIVFIHGFISTSRWWQPSLEHLVADKFHCYAVDLRAAGGSEQVESGHNLAQYAEDLQELVEKLNLSNFTLVGHSMGGGIALQYALKYQEKLKALLLASPLAPGGTTLAPEITEWVNAQQGQPEGIRMLTAGAFATLPEESYFNLLVEDGLKWGKPIYLGTMLDMSQVNITSQLAGIKIPTLVTWGDKDTVIPFQGIVDIFTHLPGCNLEIWHGVGHSGPIERPERFISLLSQFIKEATPVQV